MKKIIKISLLILFVIFVLGITTSNAAYTVTEETTADTMLEELGKTDSVTGNRNTLTGIRADVKDNNKFLYCIERNVIISSEAFYHKEKELIFPDGDFQDKDSEIYKNRYAIAYVFAAPGYLKSDGKLGEPTPKDERQWAFYMLSGQVDTEKEESNDLYEMAIEYQKYKNREEDILIKNDSAKVSVSDSKVAYGPIKIQYTYATATRNSHTDEWGGFSYAFFDENGNNVTDKVKLSTLKDGIYTEIKSLTDTSNNGYNKVHTEEYNEIDLYIVTTDNTITKLNMKIKTGKIEYKAKITELAGTYTDEYSGVEYCAECRAGCVEYQGYMYLKTSSGSSEVLSNGTVYDYKKYGATIVSTNVSNIIEEDVVGYKSINGYLSSKSSAAETFIERRGNTVFCKKHKKVYTDMNHGYQHTYEVSGLTKYMQKTEIYVKKTPCGEPKEGPKGPFICGNPVEKGNKPSQGLYIVEDSVEYLEKEIEIPINLPTVIQLTKQWIDYGGIYREKPEIDIKVYRSINPNATEEANPKVDSQEEILNKWLELSEEDSNYKLTWTKKDGDIWTAIIDIDVKFVTVGEETKPYYFKIVEKLDDENTSYYNVRYYDANGTKIENPVVDLQNDNQITIENELKSRKIEVTKKWDDYSDKYKLRPPEINITVYRCLDLEGENNWTELTEGSNYTLTWDKPEGSDTWVATIDKLALAEMVEGKKVLYKYKVVEEAPDYYNVTYSNTDGIVDQDTNKLTITNHLKNARLELTKIWDDGGKNRPETINIIVSRSLDKINWTELSPKTKDNPQGNYTITWNKTDDPNKWTAVIDELALKGKKADGTYEQYYYKIEENAPGYYNVSYSNEDGIVDRESHEITITNKLSIVDISGYVWLDGQEGTKPVTPPDGNYDEKSETGIQGIVVNLKKSTDGSIYATTVTDESGCYKFEKCPKASYYVEFEYDGINYIETRAARDNVLGTDSKADEVKRTEFNNKFHTIKYREANNSNGKDKIALTYDYSSTLIIPTMKVTTKDGKVIDQIQEDFRMTAVTERLDFTENTANLNLGLVKRGTDLAISTDLHNAKVSVNGQETEFKYDKSTNTIELLGRREQTSDNVSYSLNLYSSDYNYRIRDYKTNTTFKENGYINDGIPEGTKSGDDLEVYITYKLRLSNQSTKTATINEVKYIYDEKYEFVKIEELKDDNKIEELKENDNYDKEGQVVTLKDIELASSQTKEFKLVFRVKETDNAVKLGDFSNKAEITSYSTTEGLIDVDSQPGNFINDNKVEDDNDTAGGLKIQLSGSTERKITGKVFDKDGNNVNDVNDVIVQLIELKTVNNTTYEYIWQETVSGSGKGYKTSNNVKPDGSVDLVEYSYTKEDGSYEFSGFIPGDYIVRFIYGDGTTYDMTNNVIKYNGQDYKSVVDKNYKAEWYNASSYTAGQSVARDNEARRLETMAYSVDMNPVKGILLKLLNNVKPEALNETEKEILITIYNYCYEPDISNITQDDINKLLKEQTLQNTWMCAETSKIKVTVDNATETIINNGTPENIPVKASYDEINLGLELRPETKIELKKYITGFKLTAANGQTLVNASVDVNEYLNGTMDSNKVQGVKDYVTILNNVWQYEVVPTDINTIIDGASIEFEYTLVVKNTSATDYLSAELADKYANTSIEEYREFLTKRASELKDTIRKRTYRKKVGTTVGNSYYVGGTGANKVQTQVTSIRDYVNNNLDFISGTKPDGTAIDLNSCSSINHRILRDDYSMQDISVKYISTGETGKMNNAGNTELYTITLGKNPISSTGNLEFDTYIAEVMSYTNAAGRRSMTSTPGNAEIVDAEKREGRTHEIDEADTGRIQIGAATGEDNKTNYIIITTVIAGIAIIAAGAFVVKKYVIK